MERRRIDPLLSLREGLAINVDDLNGCLIEQADKFWHVADAHARAVGVRDQAKLDLDVLMADVGDELRTEALARQQKLTEGAHEDKVRLDPGVRKAAQAHLDAKTHAEVLDALRQAYLQRSYMLTQLVTREQRQLTMLAMEQGDASRRSSLTNALSDRVSQLRRENRRSV